MGRKKTKIALLATVTAFWPTFASPQQGGAGASGGLQVDIGVSTTLRVDDNFELEPVSSGTSTISDTTLSYGLTSKNSAHDFSLLGTGVLRFADIPGRSVSGFEDPNLRLRYVADSSNSRLALTGRYRNVDREFLDPFQVEQEEQQLGTDLADGGTLEEINAGLRYEVGLTAPLGFVFDTSYADQDYSNVTSSQLFDNSTEKVKATVLMRVNPVTTLNASAGTDTYNADDLVQTDRTTTDYSIGVTREVNPVLTLDASLGNTDVETDTLSGTNTTSGFVGSLALTKTLDDGSVFGSLSSDIDQNGERTVLSFGRDLQMSNGSLRAVIGFTTADVGGSDIIGSLAYSKQLPDGTITLSLARDAVTNNLNQEVVDTRFTAAYRHDLNNTSRLGIVFNWGETHDTGATGAQTIRTSNITASYDRDITSDWTMSSGVTLRQRYESGVGNADSTALFLTLGRNFSYRP